MMKMFIKAADVSNETRPMDVAEPWLECLLQEFFQQVSMLTVIIVTPVMGGVICFVISLSTSHF